MWFLLGAAGLLLPLLLAVGGRGAVGAPLARRSLLALALLTLLHLPTPLPEGLLLWDGRLAGSLSTGVSEGVVALLLLALLSPSVPPRAEHALLLACCSGGWVLLPWSQDLLLTFFALQLANLTLYLLLGSTGRGEGALATSLKYLLLSALASALFLAGLLLLYLATGTVELPALTLLSRSEPLGVGVLLLTLGLLLKLGVAPFHLWAPDVYGSGPAWTASLMMTLPKAPLLLTLGGLLPLLPAWEGWLAPAALLSLLLGTVGMGGQRTVRRWLAFSSLAHGGYALLLLGGGEVGGALFYTVTYLPATALLLTLLRGDPSLRSWAGLALRSPALALPVLLALLSLLGLPPLAGFTGKWVLLGALGDRPLLLGAVVVSSLLGAAYYLRAVRWTVIDLPLLRGTGPTVAGATTLALLTTLLLLFPWKPASLLAGVLMGEAQRGGREGWGFPRGVVRRGQKA